MDRILKLVYPNFVERDGAKYYCYNGLPAEIIEYLKQKVSENENIDNVLYEVEVDKLANESQSSEWFYVCHSNFYFYFQKYIDYQPNYISDGSDIGNDNNIYIYPFEIRTTINHIASEVSLTLNGKEIRYNLLDTIPNHILDLIKKGVVKILFNVIQDPCVSVEQILNFEKFVNNYGISGENVIFIWGNDVSQYIKQNYPDSKLKTTYSILPLYQQAETMWNFPRKTSLGYISDIVRPEDLKSNHIRSKRFLCFNRTPKPHRYMLAYFAIKYKLLENSYFSFLMVGNDSAEQIYNNLCLSKNPNITFQDAEEIKKIIPHHLDTQNLSSGELSGFVTDNNKKEYYLNSYVHIVSETLFVNQSLDKPFFSEKTFRPIQNLQPFIYVGEAHSLKLLQNLGFKTFDPFIDESYDSEEDPVKRIQMIEKEIVKLNNLPIKELHQWYHSIEDILTHNQKHFVSFGKINPFEKVFNDINNFYSQLEFYGF